jgi:excisionase family DNA binding protein
MMLSDSLSDLPLKINEHIMSFSSFNGHAGINSTFRFLNHLVHNRDTCFQDNASRRPSVWQLLEMYLLHLRVILTQPLFTVTTLCEHLAISRATLYRLIKKGDIEPTRIGTLTRFTGTEVERFLTRQQKQSRIKEVGF